MIFKQAKKNTLKIHNGYLLILLFSFFSSTPTMAWGFYAHRLINERAIYILPEPLFLFYKNHSEQIRDFATMPDRRRNVMPDEACRHFLDLDVYDTFPNCSYTKALAVGKDSLQKHGILHWHIQHQYHYLVDAFVNKNEADIIRLSGELGHYLADACVPLHTTSNYNGQFTGQLGIHALWESRIPEYGYEQWFLLPDYPEYIPAIFDYTNQIIKDSYSCVDSVLSIEKKMSITFSDEEKIQLDTYNGQVRKVYSKAYALEYHRRLGAMSARRMNLAITFIASVWWSAWIDAGQPTLVLFKESTNKSLEPLPEGDCH